MSEFKEAKCPDCKGLGYHFVFDSDARIDDFGKIIVKHAGEIEPCKECLGTGEKYSLEDEDD